MQRHSESTVSDRVHCLGKLCDSCTKALGLTAHETSRSNSLSEQVGRLGYHFPSTVVEQACQSLRLTLPKSGTLRLRQGTRQQPQRGSHRATRSAHNKNDQITKPRAASVGNDMDQSEIDARAAFAIRDLFPKIPERDVQLIVAQAFQKV